MKLKRLVLQGYKTFASKTEFVFDAGLTAIVGPNGSGKSNVVDALRWVLGEQSYGELRGKRSVDMIFAGSQQRPRAGMAQAILTLDNSSGWLPIDYSEVEIGRRTYRSGENEYLLNGQKVRLRDVQELLAKSGLAERTYTIIGQGLIDRALSLRAEERRALFEEAAGISHYKVRRAETLRRLQETQHNLQRVHDILAEIQPRLGSLKRQANRAQNYEQVAKDLRHLLRQWYGFQWEQAKKKLRTSRVAAADSEHLWQESRAALLRLQGMIDDKRRAIGELEQQRRGQEEERDRLRDLLDKSGRQVAVLQERQTLIQRQRRDLEAELPRLQEQREAAAAALNEALADLQTAQAEQEIVRQELQQFNASFQAQQTTIDQTRQALSQAEKAQRQAQTELAQAEGRFSQLQERLAERERQAPDPQELARLETQISQSQLALDEGRQELAALEKQQQAVEEAQRSQHRLLKQLRQESAAHTAQLNRQQNEIARLESRVELLAQMRHRESNLKTGAAIVGRLAQFLTIPDVYRRAIEGALGHQLNTVLLEEEAALWSLLAEEQTALVAAVSGRGQWAVSHEQLAIGSEQEVGVVGWAVDLVQVDSVAQGVAQALLGHLLLVENSAAAYQIAWQLPPGYLAVTLDGVLVQAGGVVERAASDPQQSILAREEAWRAAAAALEEARHQLQELQTIATSHENTIQSHQEAADKLTSEGRYLEQKSQRARQGVSNHQRTLERSKQQQAYLNQQTAAYQQELLTLRQRLTDTQTAISQRQGQLTQLTEDLATWQARYQLLPIAEGQQQRESWRQKSESARTIVAGRQAVVDSRRTTLNQVEAQLARLQEQLARLQNQQAQLDLASEQSQLTQLQEQLDGLHLRLKPLQERGRELYEQLARLEQQVAQQQRQTHELETQYTQSRVAFSQQENLITGLQERIKADLGVVALSYDEDQIGATPLPMKEVVEELPIITELPDEIDDNIHQLRSQLQRMGAINPDAPQEYEETQRRFDFLTTQVDDLTRTESQLRHIIAELDVLTSRAFAETVTKVNTVFGDMFKRLFGGGSAQLVLTEPDNLSLTGVDIIARLPSRREQGLALLSGGERSLTAAALIFSLLKVSPTPFCVLDEVDAMLDEANVNRFRDVLDEMSHTIQFIVVTHNRGTVQAADVLYGISMGSDSVSQALSVKPEEYLNQQQPLL
ncbi:MAG: chromosome segregation protein SMC [Anaerolineae bacterium]|nr:chromosome segregation protein SMC [Anaerolineae bacterium]